MLDFNDLSLPCLIADALADTDNIYQPAAHAFANFIASKISSLADVEIARLTDHEIAKLIHRLPEAEIRGLVDDEISRLSDRFTTIGEDIIRQFSTELTVFLLSFLGLTFINVGLMIIQSYKERQSSKHGPIVTTNATQAQPKPSTKPILLSKYPGTPDLKGLKDIAETYIQENISGFRQEVEQTQEDTSRVVDRSSRSILLMIPRVCRDELESFSLLTNSPCKD